MLEQVGFACLVEPSAYEEKSLAKTATELVLQHARGKALDVAAHHQATQCVVLGADTVIAINHDILGKPRDDTDAAAMLRRLSGRAHLVLTAYAIVDCSDATLLSDVVSTTVWFRHLLDDEIDAYIATGEPKEKAGAYAIQAQGALLIERISGDYFSVVGLPLFRVGQALQSFGVKPNRCLPPSSNSSHGAE